MTFDEYVVARLPALLRYAVMLTGDPHLAQDVVQETMVRAQLKWRRIAAVGQPDTYVRRMLVNQFLSWRRLGWFSRTVLRREVDRPEVVPDHAHRTVERDAVWELLATLPRRQRVAVVLRFYEGLADAQVAEAMGCAVGTVRAHISRALATLRDGLGPPVSPGPAPPVGQELSYPLSPATVRSPR